MKVYKLIVLSFLGCLLSNGVKAQDLVIDSLNRVFKNANSDTARCRILVALIAAEGDDNIWPQYNDQLRSISESNLKKYPEGDTLHLFYLKNLAAAFSNEGYLANVQGDITKALYDFEESMNLEKRAGNKAGVAECLNNIGTIYLYKGEATKALDYYKKSLLLREQTKDQRGIAESFNNLATIYNEIGDVPQALEHYQKALSIQERINAKEEISISLNNLGTLYEHQRDYEKALGYYQRSLKIQQTLNNKQILAGSLHNVAHILERQGKTKEALDYFDKSLGLSEESGNMTGMAHCLNSLGSIYKKEGNLSKALNYYQKSFGLWEKLGGKQGMALTTKNIAAVLFDQGKISEAIEFAKQSLKLSQEIGFPENIKDAASTLSFIYKKTGDWKSAYEMQILFKQMSDSTVNTASRKAFLQRTFQYEYDKKAAADSIKSAGERRILNAELRQQKLQRSVLFCGIAVVALLALFMYNRFRVTQKQKQIIEVKERETQLQKNIIEEKHKEISDSINYAERIQRSFLATKDLLDENLKDYFILFKPKDIVSGDFYWAAKLQNGQFAFAVADSTGHGVPGAIISLLNITSLEKAIEKHSNPAEILNQTRQTIINRLKNDGSAEGGKDGMDCTLIAFDFQNKVIHMAAAQNPLWIIRRLNSSEDENAIDLIELSPDKLPVGKHEHDHKSFTQQTFQLQSGDMVYATTDGFADQFGGPKGKKFMHKRLKELLLTISKKSTDQQKEILLSTLSEWEGKLEQVDDITLVGIRIV